MIDELDKTVELQYAGFWRRFFAFIIDSVLISIFVFPLVVVIGLVAPQHIVVSVPFDLFTTERVIKTEKTRQKNSNGLTMEGYTSLIEVTCLGHWKYLYKGKAVLNTGEGKTSWQLLNPATKQEMNVTTADDIAMFVLFIYWIVMEGSRFQASLGKMALRIKVIDNRGKPLSMVRALGRNLLKILSATILLIGFAMAGWTKKKQALQDMITGCYVVVQD
jgi:uncharacterized RDD family membrane protein YckC